MRKNFGSRLKSLLENKNISQKELADKLEITEATLSRYINNLIVPKIEVVSKMASLLDVSVDFLIGNEREISEFEEKEALKKLLQKTGFMAGDEDLTDEELEKLIKFVNANKEFLKGDK